MKINKNYKYDYIIIPIENEGNNLLLNYLFDAVNFINERLLNGNNIFVFCKNGIQCSPIIMVAYLIKYAKISSELSIKYVLSKNTNLFKNNIFYLPLIDNFIKKL